MKFSEFMWENRKRLDMSLHRLESMTGISRQQLRNYENERSGITLEKAQLICQAFEKDYFIKGR